MTRTDFCKEWFFFQKEGCLVLFKIALRVFFMKNMFFVVAYVVLFLQEGGTFLVSYFFRNVIFHKCIYFPKGACLSYLF